jgi:hypothetical protein
MLAALGAIRIMAACSSSSTQPPEGLGPTVLVGRAFFHRVGHFKLVVITHTAAVIDGFAL